MISWVIAFVHIKHDTVIFKGFFFSLHRLNRLWIVANSWIHVCIEHTPSIGTSRIYFIYNWDIQHSNLCLLINKWSRFCYVQSINTPCTIATLLFLLYVPCFYASSSNCTVGNILNIFLQFICFSSHFVEWTLRECYFKWSLSGLRHRYI